MNFLGGLDGKESACNGGDPGSVPELGRFPGEGKGNAFHYSCLENSKTEKPGGTAHGVAQSQTRLSTLRTRCAQQSRKHHFAMLAGLIRKHTHGNAESDVDLTVLQTMQISQKFANKNK